MSISCTGCGMSPIPLVPHGELEQFIKARQWIRDTPQVRVAVVDTSVARTAVRLFLASRTGKALLAGMAISLGVRGVIAPERVDEALMRDIEEFLKRQLKQNGKGTPPKGVAVPLPFKGKKTRPGPVKGPQIKDGIETLLDPIIRPEKEGDDERRKKTRIWFERRWRNSPGLAFALKNKRERSRFTRSGRKRKR